MSNTETITQHAIHPDAAAQVARILAPVVVNLEAIVVNGKQAHWHVLGENFIGVHELLDSVVAHAQDWADLAAERIIALGKPVDARLQTVAAETTTPVLTSGFRQSEETIGEMIAQLDAAAATVNAAVRDLDELDQTSQDVAIEIARGLDKDRWFLWAHLRK